MDANSRHSHLPSLHRPLPEQGVRVGRVVSVTGARAVVLLDREPRATAAPKRYRPEIGMMLKVETPSNIILGLISSLSAPAPVSDAPDEEIRLVEVEFVGEIETVTVDGSDIGSDTGSDTARFQRGVSIYPTLGDDVRTAEQHELAMAYACDTESAIEVGVISQDPSIPAMLKIDDLLGKHFAAVGTTGTGKSCAVTLILDRILARTPNGHVLLLDIHREYARVFGPRAEVVTAQDLNLPFWFFNFEEMVEIVIGGHQGRDIDVEILRELIPMAKYRFALNRGRERSLVKTEKLPEPRSISVDTPLPYRISDLIALLDEHIGKLELRNELTPYKRLKARIEQLSRDPRFVFMFGNLTVTDTMADVLSRLFRIPVNGKPVTVLELAGFPAEVINVVVSVLSRMAFDFGMWSKGRVPITLVCEEAHRYVPNDRRLGFEPAKRAISRIAKEGRKYGVSLTIITQRPAELDPTILSQCSTILALRLTNDRDLDILRSGISDSAASLLDFVPAMRIGEAIVFGEGAALPTRIRFDRLADEMVPTSTGQTFSRGWMHDVNDPAFLHCIVSRWREQLRFETDASGLNAATADQPEPGHAFAHAPQAHAPQARPESVPAAPPDAPGREAGAGAGNDGAASPQTGPERAAPSLRPASGVEAGGFGHRRF